MKALSKQKLGHVVRCWSCSLGAIAFVLVSSAVAQEEPPQPPVDIAAQPAPQPASELPAPQPSPSVGLATPTVAVQASPAPAPDPAKTDKSAQENDCEDRSAATEGAGMFMLGVALIDLSALNDRLRANGYETVPSALPIIGGEGHAVFESGFVAGGHGAAILGPTLSGPGALEAQIGGGFGMADFGFALVRTQSVLFTLTGGIGGYGLSLAIGEKRSSRFDDVLSSPQRGTTLTRGGLLVGLNLGIDARIPIGNEDRGRRGFFTLGVRLGGLYGPAISDWSLPEGSDATHGPSTGLTGGYAALAIGFGGGRVSRQQTAK
jgi:hypothetical protein